MKKLILALLIGILNATATAQKPWDHGRLKVSDNNTYLEHEDGTPMFWLANTGWLLPEKLTRTEAEGLIDATANAGYNVIMVQTLNAVPSINVYGQYSHTDGWNFDGIDDPKTYGYWDHMDYIIRQAEQQGIYIGMVCIWGGLVKSGKMDAVQAESYGKFLAERYKDSPNIIWIIGGDIKGDVKPDVWEALATSIKAADDNHLMTFHPFGRTSSAYWWNDAEWLDFNMFQSGHRRYDQTRGDGDDKTSAAVAEDNWRYVADALGRDVIKPVIDGEPSYEDIPQGLHDTAQPRWTSDDVRRYAYWSVFAGAAGHTYGHNSIMQMHKPGDKGGYGATKTWYDALNDPGFNQMRYLKDLILTFPYTDRVPDQSVIASSNGERYGRNIATRGNDYLMVYTYTNSSIVADLDKISGDSKQLFWFNPSDGSLTYIDEVKSSTVTLSNDYPGGPGNDYVLIAFDSAKPYLEPGQKHISPNR